MHNNWLTKRIFLNALNKNKIFLTKESIVRSKITGYNVYILYKNQVHPIEGVSCYWSDFYKSYRPEGGNYNKPIAIIESIAHHLGIKSLDKIKCRII